VSVYIKYPPGIKPTLYAHKSFLQVVLKDVIRDPPPTKVLSSKANLLVTPVQVKYQYCMLSLHPLKEFATMWTASRVRNYM